MISCCFFPLKAPNIAWVIEDGCRTVSEYRNMFEFPDMMGGRLGHGEAQINYLGIRMILRSRIECFGEEVDD